MHVIPIKRAFAQQLAGKYKLLPPTGLPEGFLAPDEHPFIVLAQYLTDIRQRMGLELRVNELQGSYFYIPFVDAANDGRTPFLMSYQSWQSQLIPRLVGSLYGANLKLGYFEPEHKAYNDLGSGQYSFQNFVGLNNPSGSLGVLSPVFTTRFNRAPRGQLTAQNFKDLLTTPVRATMYPNTGRCVRFEYVS
ncbi:hypothetical protein IE81DRAFT_191628 [Ceraceosorus guamensis]|uniref:Uncharacterized protein n=1 Tax=Ceraceosorus guamensis TaxID=1522189 RepID=A0A316W6E6_9BASI|nr:hypothetical protein IE81DRAFT_191628 [Ceraceosorus guamensis]PWN45459.1 hypothetical protein IE81DRAFT_191628 [Ceraceosorus guamensis]